MGMPIRTSDGLTADAEAAFEGLFFTAAGRTNPYPHYHQLRQADPIHHSRLGIWVLTRYDDCWATLRDPEMRRRYPNLA